MMENLHLGRARASYDIAFDHDVNSILNDVEPDGLTNAEEIVAGTDPCDDDSDNDSVNDGDELNRMVGGQPAPTDPLSDDTDGDGLTDNVETNTGVNNGPSDTGTDPLVADGDGDGLNDGEEIAAGTSPFDQDTDGDSWSDASELLLGTDPLSAASKPSFDASTIVDVDATALGVPDGTVVANLANPAAAGEFTTLIGTIETMSHPSNNDPSVLIQGLAFDGDKMTAAIDAPTLGMIGNQTYTARAWVWNPGLENEEAIVSWGHRGGPLGSNAGMHHGTHGTFGAIGHWGGGAGPTEPDVSWGTQNGTDINNTAGRWTQLSYVYDGLEDRVFIDGQLSNSEEHPNLLDVHDTYDDGNPTLMCIGSESDAGNVNSTPIRFAGTIARVQVYDLPLSDGQILAEFEKEAPYFFDGIPPKEGDPLELAVAPSGADLVFTWKSRAGKVYNLRSDVNLDSGPAAGWPLVPPHGDLAATPPLNTLTIPRPADPERFYVVEESDAPPLFSDDLESGVGDWTTVVHDLSANTQWELGAPTAATGPTGGADSSASSWSTNLDAYGPDSEISLRSPAIDLTGVGGATLSFDQWRDADGVADTAAVRFLRASDQAQLGADVVIDMGVFDTSWRPAEVTVPAEALGETVLVEFYFVSDGSADLFSGWSIDNVEVRVN